MDVCQKVRPCFIQSNTWILEGNGCVHMPHKCAVVLQNLFGLCLIEHLLVIFSLLADLH